MTLWNVTATAIAVAKIEVTAATEEGAITLAQEVGGFEISDIDELIDFDIERSAERVEW